MILDEKEMKVKEGVGQVLGKNVERTDAKRKVEGKTVFGFDYGTIAKKRFENLIHTKIVRSEHAHAEIENIDTSKAEKMQGVVKVFTHEDVPDVKFTTAGQAYPEPSPYDTRVLNEKVRFYGEPIAIVAAESEEIAEKASEKIEVEYKELPVLLDMEEALDSEVEIHEGGNLQDEIDVEVGNTEKAIENSDVVVDREYETPIQKHCHMEPHACVSRIDENGKLFIESTNQVVYHVRRILSKIFDLPLKDIRVKSWEIGGGFGDKQELGIEHYASLVTLETGRPALVYFDREEQFFFSRRRHGAKLRVRIGADEDGTLNGIHIDALSDTGGYGTHGVTVSSNMGTMTLPVYTKHCENLKFTAKVIYTNKPPGGAFRGYGTVQGGFALESAMDELSEELEIDPVELRLKNAIEENMLDPISKVISEGGKIIPREIKSCGLTETLERGRKLFEWEKKKKQTRKENDSKKYGVGVASAMKGSGVAGFELASSKIKLNEDGSVLVTTGASDMGQGLESVLCQIVAETVGIELEDVDIISADTDEPTFSMGTYASSGTYMEGNAVNKAAKELKEKILRRAADMMDESPQVLETGDGKVFMKENPDESLKIREVAMDTIYGEKKTQLEGFGDAEDIISPPPFSTHFVEVEVDEETGKVEITKYLTLSDIGIPLNPTAAEGQIEGAVAQGIGLALHENLEFDEKGCIKNPFFKDYHIPTSVEVPEIETELIKTYEPTGPYGAKSVGEIGTVPPAPAIANAIYDATGKRFRKLPIKPDEIIEKLESP
ncbi:hypothetical protein AKJ40_00355 [candidate division MSBL1 archaeon SCGC-AAA259M10]|uniref:Aldehyde oxidase/xanthine dehydrogenase a/b hammerhead domain-containing protein n=2 Tax=candidate division MSBL1 TaxID=215777 RepID=A0A133V341_9EURY|nr:hypothetical protein AKJ40_00355 [candidate division MSBL1 archaeon SCGC-AAA259M10]